MIRLLLSCFALLSCNSKDIEVPQNVITIEVPKPPVGLTQQRSFLALGDSYTIGQSVPEKDRWSVILSGMLENNGYLINKHDIIAKTGWTTQELMQEIATRNNTNQYDMVSLLIGVNNQYRGQTLDCYRIEFRELLWISIKFAKNNPNSVFVLSIPDWGVTPFANGLNKTKIATEIDAFNNVAQEECKQMGVSFLDITSITRNNTGDSMFASDQLHFSGNMHTLWATKALAVALSIMKK